MTFTHTPTVPPTKDGSTIDQRRQVEFVQLLFRNKLEHQRR